MRGTKADTAMYVITKNYTLKTRIRKENIECYAIFYHV